MIDTPSRPASDEKDRAGHDRIDASRMSFGDHLDELRRCLIRGLLGSVLGCVIAFAFGTDILRIVIRPLLAAQQANGLQPSVQALAPVAAFAAYLKISIISGLILSTPWLLYQIWRFVESGLYPGERRFAQRLMAPSVVLFGAGVIFLYFIVLPLLLQFFIRFNERLGMSDVMATALSPLVRPESQEPLPEQVVLEGAKIPVLADDPPHPAPGDAWINRTTHRLMVHTGDETWSTALDPAPAAPVMKSQFAIDFYITFVLMLALAFGIAFETPVVVFFLAWSGLVTTTQMGRARRYVLLASVILGALLTPPDVISQLLLAGPMYLLFELGILVAKLAERPGRTANSE